MLQWMHRISTSWVASLFMGALALSFVVWGIADVFVGMNTTALATVGAVLYNLVTMLAGGIEVTLRESD